MERSYPVALRMLIRRGKERLRYGSIVAVAVMVAGEPHIIVLKPIEPVA